MFKRFRLITVASLLFATGCFGLSIPSVSAQSNPNDNTIWNGLWAGANFDFSGLSSTSSSSTTPAPTSSAQTYAALGDSVAAGLGLGGSGQCGRSTAAYPTKVAASLHLKLTHAACSGATVGDLVTQQHMSGPNPAAQLNAAFAAGTPKLITITAGANDVHWNGYFLRKCYYSTCGTTADKVLADGYMTALELKLHYMFNSISARSGGHPPKVIITGYYTPLSGQCALVQQRVTASEINWLNSELATLNRTIKSVSAQYSYVKYVPVNFAGHDICSSDPWVQGPNDTAPFHPTAKGQDAIAKAVLAAY